MVDQYLLNDTLQKINASLNRRFEKDADLYISKQDEYEIKKNLCSGAYGAIVDMAKAKGISHDIIVKVIMRNAGVLNVRDVQKFRRELKPIFEDADYQALSYMMEDVLGNNVYMQREIRHIMFSYYMGGISASARVSYWKGEGFDFDMQERAVLFNLIIEKTKHREPAKTLKFKTDFIEDAFERYPSLMKGDAFARLKETLDDKEQKDFFKYLCREMETPFIDDETYNLTLVDAYASYGEKAFNDAVSHIKDTSESNFKLYVKAVWKLFRGEKDRETLLRMFDTMCRVAESDYIKRHVKREIDRKVWKEAKSNEVLYTERKAKIDGLMSALEEEGKSYSSFADIMEDISKDTKPKGIAYVWINMKTPDFEQSILDSFTQLSDEDSEFMYETYTWLFDHSMRRNIRALNRICELLARPLYEFSMKDIDSEFYDTMDDLWVDYVVRYKLQGPAIKKYMFEKHFDRVKEWE